VRTIPTYLPLLALFVASCVPASPGPELDQDKLIGGTVAEPGELDMVLWVSPTIGGCSAARVGPRHILTAAHCVEAVVNESDPLMSLPKLSPLYTPPNLLYVSNEKMLQADSPWITVSIADVHVHPAWFETCGTTCQTDLHPRTSPFPPDVAVIVTAEDLPETVAQGRIDVAPVMDGEEVTMLGYGCEAAGDESGWPRQLKWAAVNVVQELDPGRGTVDMQAAPETFRANYLSTPGPNRQEGAPSLCPGDSGGPLLRASDQTIVGVNSFDTHDEGLAYANYFTALGDSSTWNMREWLESVLPAESIVDGEACRLGCDDDNPCTKDDCTDTGECTHIQAEDGASCSDGDVCNGDEVCDAEGVCNPGEPLDCGEGDPCTLGSCDPVSGCARELAPAGTSCSDGDACNGEETCDEVGLCQGGTALDCADDNPCTEDACNADTGCDNQSLAEGTPCLDDNACNGEETCSATGNCQIGRALRCNDDNTCTADSCDPAEGCKNIPVEAGTSCSDGNACNGREECGAAGTCQTAAPLSCDDDNPCTADSCDPRGGCRHDPVAAGTSCSDGEACNGEEVCDAFGLCAADAATAGSCDSPGESSAGGPLCRAAGPSPSRNGIGSTWLLAFLVSLSLLRRRRP